MARTLWRKLIPAAALVGLTLGAMSVPAAAAPARGAHRAGGSLTVFAAASLQAAFTTIGAQFDKLYGANVTFDFGGSDTLATQIVQGAPADVFASANNMQMNMVADKDLVATTPAVFVRNRLVVIVPRDNPGHVYSLPDLGRPGLRLVLAAPTVPVGKYARAAFTVMAGDAAFGPAFLTAIARNTVSDETDVKAVAAKVELGEADAGVVYVTDVTAQVAARVSEIAIPAPYNQVATYPIAALKGSQNAALAARFVHYVLSRAGQQALHKAGFSTSAPRGGYSPTIQVGGLVSHAMTLAVSDLRKMPATTVMATLRSAKKALGRHRFSGVLLNSVVQAASPIANSSFKNDMLRLFVLVHATDGNQVTVSLADILPTFGHQPVLLAYAEDGKPLARSAGAVELIVPGDYLAGRDVKNVDQIVVETPYGTP